MSLNITIKTHRRHDGTSETKSEMVYQCMSTSIFRKAVSGEGEKMDMADIAVCLAMVFVEAARNPSPLMLVPMSDQGGGLYGGYGSRLVMGDVLEWWWWCTPNDMWLTGSPSRSDPGYMRT